MSLNTRDPLSALLIAALALGALACSAPETETAPKLKGLSIDLVVDVNDEFVKKWNASAVSLVPELSSIEEAQADSAIYLGCMISGYGTNESGVANLRVDVEAIAPTGDAVLRVNNFALYKRKPEPGRDTVLANSRYNMTIESSDPAGKYTIRAVATDLVSGETAEISREVTVVHP